MVYVFRVKGTSKYKIGESIDVKQRHNQIQKANPDEVLIERVYDTKNSKHLEKTIHKMYVEEIIHGEWYDLKESDVNTIDILVSKYDPPAERNFIRNQSRKNKTNYVETIHEILELCNKYHIGRGKRDFYRQTGIKGEGKVIVANMLNMSKGSLHNLLKVNELRPELLQKIDSGEISLSAAYKSLW